MKLKPEKLYAVLTGDIVKSRSLSASERRKLSSAFAAIESELSAWPEVRLPLSRFRGDGWQVLVTRPERSLRVALFIRASLRMRFEGKKVDSRVGIGIGRVDFVPGRRVAEGDGPAYRLSGAALDRKGWRRLVFSSMDDQEPMARVTTGHPAVSVVFDLVDLIVTGWTPAQARAVVGALQGFTQHQIAGGWETQPITQQAVAQHLSRSGWDGIQSALDWYERTLQA